MRTLSVLLFLILALVCSPREAAAQHPCDGTPATVSTKSPTDVGFCFSNKDVDGNPVTNASGTPTTTLVSAKVTIDGATAKTVSNLAPSGAPNAAGDSYYLVTGVTAAKGARTARVTVTTADGESDPADAYTFSVVGGKPAKPTRVRVVSN